MKRRLTLSARHQHRLFRYTTLYSELVWHAALLQNGQATGPHHSTYIE